MTIGKTLGSIVLAGAMAFSGCAAGLKAKVWEKSAEGYRVSVSEIDQNEDRVYDTVVIEAREEATDKLVSKMAFIDNDYDGNLDIVMGDIRDAEGNMKPNGEPNPDGVLDTTLPYDFFFISSFGRTPTEEERKVEHVYKMLVEGN